MFIQKRSVTTNSVGCPASIQRLSAVVEGGKQDGGYSRIQSYAAVYLWSVAVHTAMAIGYALSSLSHLPMRLSAVTLGGHSGRVVLLANHRYDKSSAHLCSSSGLPRSRSALAVRHCTRLCLS